MSSWQNSQTGLGVDAVLELSDGRWAGFEVKLDEASAEAAACSLLHMAAKIGHDRQGKSALIVLTGGRYAYKLPDCVCVVPITVIGLSIYESLVQVSTSFPLGPGKMRKSKLAPVW